MLGRKQYFYSCSLRTGTLILLWVVMVGSALHMWAVNFNQNYDNKISIREKRSLPILNVVEEVKNKAKNTVDNAFSSIKKAPADLANTIKVVSGNIINGLAKGITDIIDDIFGVHKRLGELGTFAQNFLKKSVHGFFFIWSVLGITSSACGIYGIHKNIPMCLTFSVAFFYFSVISGVLIILQINVDSNIQRKIFILHEFGRIECTDSGFSTMVINVGLLVFIGALMYCLFVVKKYRIILRKIVAKEKDLKDGVGI